MSNLAKTYQHIADILSFEISGSELESTLSDPKFDWDHMVIEGSRHLVLPAIYCRLKSKNLSHVLPDELNSYLKEITSINRNRNLAILKQINELTTLFNKHGLNYVFLKGTAILVLGFYDDISERMIGDIDILVEENQLDLAFNLLKDAKYYTVEESLGERFFEHKHLPRLVHKHHICCVELHRRLFTSKKENYLMSENILLNRQKAGEVPVPSYSVLMYHNILNYQINDFGNFYKSISFRSAYDTIVLLKTTLIEVNNNKLIRNFIDIIGIFFKDVHRLKPKQNFSTWFYQFKLRHIYFYKFWHKYLKMRKLFGDSIKRLPKFIGNKTYRTAIYNERTRIYRIITSVFKN